MRCAAARPAKRAPALFTAILFADEDGLQDSKEGLGYGPGRCHNVNTIGQVDLLLFLSGNEYAQENDHRAHRPCETGRYREGCAEQGCVVLYDTLEEGSFPLVEDAHVKCDTLGKEHLQRRLVLDLSGVRVQGESCP